MFIEDISRAVKPGESISLLPAARKLMDSHLSKDDPEANCLPTGVPRMAPYPWRPAQTKDQVYFLFEGNIHSYRIVYMDGRQHPADVNPTWFGHSVGRYEKETLAIDSVGFNDKFWFDFSGYPHTEQLHTVERFTRTDFGTLADEVTIEDRGAYAKPFTVVSKNRLDPNIELMEYICQENNRDPQHIQGPAGPPANPGDPPRPAPVKGRP